MLKHMEFRLESPPALELAPLSPPALCIAAKSDCRDSSKHQGRKLQARAVGNTGRAAQQLPELQPSVKEGTDHCGRDGPQLVFGIRGPIPLSQIEPESD